MSFFFSIVRDRHVRRSLGERGRALLVGVCAACAPAVCRADFQLGLTHHPGASQVAGSLKNLPVSWRNDLSWHLVEQAPGAFAMPAGRIGAAWECVRRHRQPMLWILDYGNPLHTDGWIDTDAEREAFARYARWAARLISGQWSVGRGQSAGLSYPTSDSHRQIIANRQPPTASPTLEIWNEWDFGFGGPDGLGTAGDPVEYVRLLATTAKAIRVVDPNITIVGGSVSSSGFGDWLKAACEAGLLEHLDVLSIHPYHSRHGGAYRLPEVGLLNEIRRVRAIIARYLGRGRETGDRGQGSGVSEAGVSAFQETGGGRGTEISNPGQLSPVSGSPPPSDNSRLLSPASCLRPLSTASRPRSTANGAASPPLWITELGYHTSSLPYGYTLEEQAKVIGRAILLTWADPNIEATFIYKTIDGSADRGIGHHNLGLLFHDGSPKPSHAVYRELARWIDAGAGIEPLWKDEGKRLKDEGSLNSGGERTFLSVVATDGERGTRSRSAVLQPARVPTQASNVSIDSDDHSTTPGTEATRLRNSGENHSTAHRSPPIVNHLPSPSGNPAPVPRLPSPPATPPTANPSTALGTGRPPSTTVSPPILHGYAITFPDRPFLDKWVLWTVFPEDRVRVTLRHATGFVSLRARPLGASAGNDPTKNEERGIKNTTPSSLNPQPSSFPVLVTDHPVVLEATDFRGMDPDFWRIVDVEVLSSRPRPIELPKSATRHRPILGREEKPPL